MSRPVNRTRLLRTTSFRLTLLYAGLTALSFVLLFVVVYVSTGNFMDRQIDATVATELAEVQSDAAGKGGSLAGIVRDLGTRSDGYFYLLQDAQGAVVAGNLPALEPVPGIREWGGPAHHRSNPLQGLRGRGVRLADGGYLFVGMSTYHLHEMQEHVVRVFLWGFAAALALALAGGTLMSLSVARRIEGMSQTSRDIVGGDLGRRIPLAGNADEFDHLAASLNAMLDRIQLLMDGLRQVSTDIAHDLRTPLTRLRQRIEQAQRRGTAPAADVLGDTLRDLDGILETFAALLRIAQIESGTRRAGFARLDLGEVLRTVLEVYQPAAEERGQVLGASLDGELAVRGDRDLLTQMFANLVENASRHGGAGARIEVTARPQHGMVLVAVADNGPGIPEGERDKVLRRFYRLESSRSTPGNGLGLSLAAAVAALHDTRLRLLDNHPGLRVEIALAPA